MVPAPSCPNTWDYWMSPSTDSVELTCLLPNSIYIPLTTSWDATLQDVKDDIWFRAVNYPLFNTLQEMTSYVFQFVNSLAVTEEIDDETKRICDIKPVCGVLVIVERSFERPGEDLLNRDITWLIGKPLKEFDNLKSSEVNDFRLRMRGLAEENLVKRAQSTRLERLRYQCPPRLADHPDIPATLRSHLNNQCFLLFTIVNTEDSFSSNVPATRTPRQHIEVVLRRFANSLNMHGDHSHNYVLKVCGRQEYLFGDHPFIQFLYIQEMVANDAVPKVMIDSIDKVPLALNRDVPSIPERRRMTSEYTNTIRRKKNESSWNINKDYSCVVNSVSKLNVDPGRVVEVICQAGIFHGGKSLCEVQKTQAAVISKDGIAQWDEELTFSIKVYNIPRMARLCFGVYEIVKVKSKKKGKDSGKDAVNRLTWANTMIFDYKEQLRTESLTLAMWTHIADDTQGDDFILHPLGTVIVNPITDSCATLKVQFSNYDCQHPILFPRAETVRAFAERHEGEAGAGVGVGAGAAEEAPLEALASQAGGGGRGGEELHEQERRAVWGARRRVAAAAPHLLPRLLACVEWGERAPAAGVAPLLAACAPLRVDGALELLDHAYADAAVRAFAVASLAPVADADLLLYLLQLVQALKHESFLMCDLALFLLRRAFTNMTVGHYLFWHLRSEMHVPSVSVRFGLMLEAYCRGCQEHIKILKNQIMCLDKLKWVSQCVRKKKEISRARAVLYQHLQEQHCVSALCEFVSPLNPSFVCKKIKTDSCRVMDSKMRPLMLNFENIDPHGSDIKIILKIGDDLRQDMFTLQMLRIMDRLWKNHGYDFRLNPYNCISMEYSVGMIEVVEDAETVANIQKQSALWNAASTISKTTLLQWLRRNTENNEMAFNKAVDEFTMSCAGYCVATYVLGIADRHPDNIMVKKSGQLFHIDFGHFLGHFKQKYGFKRERVPFVLTHDFIHVINKGQKGSGDNEPIDFKIFKEHCETAFKILRKHGHLILSLFSMMISTGLPELSSEKDLQYLKETLVLELSEEKAMEHFRQKFTEAVKNSWTTSFNWAFHNFDKNN